MTAGRFFLISPPTDGSKSTHQTSPRLIGDVRDHRLSPLTGFRLPGSVGCHLSIGRHHVLPDAVRADEGLDETADLVPADNLMETGIDLLVDGDGKLFLHTC